MTQETLAHCEVCGVVIPEVRLTAVPGARKCVPCQEKQERMPEGMQLVHVQDPLEKGEEEAPVQPVEVQEDRLVAGNWSGGMMDLVMQNGELRNLIRTGNKGKARELLQVMQVEAQAALVVLDEDPEEALSITGMDAEGNPGYRTDVVALLPTEMLAGLIAYDPDEQRFNTELIRAMSPDAFKRTVEDTLEPMDNAELRSQVSWEWLQALAALKDANKRAELLQSVDPDIFQEALLTRMGHLKLNERAATVEVDGMEVSFSRFRLFSEDAAVGASPSSFIEDPGVGRVVDALYEADPVLLRFVIRGAWKRQLDQIIIEEEDAK